MSEQPVRAGTKPAKPIPDSAEVEPVQVRGAFLQRSNHDKLASDKIGEELNPNACIWRLYAEEAQEYDTAMAQERNRNLDTMLLFATLFSAIVTAFLIQSTDLLEQDYSKESMQLLLALVQSQRRIEAGTPDTTLALVEIPKFVPSASTRAANILWFAALIISLGAAVVAMLAKEWLSAFTLYRTRHAHEYALKRQNRLEALKAWNMRPIIGLLPICLNAALFLFSLGLIVRLWDLDGVVAAFTTGISAVVSMVYVYFVLAGALSPTCPYKSRLSGYVRWIIPLCILKQFDSRKAAAPDEQKSVKPEEVDLLTWLLHYSSDPTLGSYVTQALAGLKSLPLGLPTFLNTEKKLEELCTTYKQNRKFLVTLFDLGAQAIDQLRMTPTGGRNELAISGGLNAARLAVAISEIYPHALTWQLCTVVETIQAQGGATERVGGNTLTQANSPELPVQGNSIVITVTQSATREAAQTQENRSEGASVVRDSSIDAHENKTEQDSSLIIDLPSAIKITDLENVFSALDLVWAETSPALVLSAYAYLATAELKVVRHALLFSSRYKEKLPANVLTKLQSLDEEYLQERYNRALSRTALVVKASLCQLTSEGSQEVQSAVADLLMEALELVNQDWPNSNNSWPEFGTDPNLDKLNKEISITISTKRNATYRVTCRRQARCFELMESLVELCLGDDMMDALCLEGFRVASFNLLIAFWLAYFQQLNIDNNRRLRIDGNQQLTAEDDLDYDPEDFPWAVQKWKTVPFQTIPYDSQSSAEIIIYRTIVVTYIAIGLRAFDSFSWKPWNSNNDGLIQLIFRLLFSWSDALSKIAEKLKSNATPDKPAIYHEWLPRNEILVDWILLASTVYPNTVANNAKYFEAGNKTPWRLSWCIANLIAMTETLANGQVDILGSLRSTHLNTQFSDSTRKHMGLNVHQLIDFIYTASQAIDREATTPVIGAVLGQVTSYIKEAASGCPICLNSFTHGSGFYILSKVGLTESDRAAAGEAVSAVVAQLHASQIHVHENIVPSLFEAMCCVCDIDDLALCDMRPFIDGAVFQLQKLPGGIARYVTPGTISSIQKVLGKLKDWGKEWSHNGVQCLDEISALQHEVQEYTDQKTWRHWGSSRYISGAPEPPSLVVPPQMLPEPHTDTTNSEPDNEVCNHARFIHSLIPLDTGNRAPDIGPTSNIVLKIDADNVLTGLPNKTQDLGRIQRSLPVAFVPLPESADESSDGEE